MKSATLRLTCAALSSLFITAAVAPIALAEASTQASTQVSTQAVSPSQLYESTLNSVGLGIDTTFVMGAVTKNGFGFPKLTIGLGSGLDVRKFVNLPSLWSVQEAEKRLMLEPGLSPDELLTKVCEAVNPGQFSYVQFGTETVTKPKIGIGALIPFKKGYGNKTYFDIGVNYPTWVNIGVIILF